MFRTMEVVFSCESFYAILTRVPTKIITMTELIKECYSNWQLNVSSIAIFIPNVLSK